MGFENVEALYRQADRISEQLRSGASLAAADLARALIATEFVFASDYYAGWDWVRSPGSATRTRSSGYAGSNGS